MALETRIPKEITEYHEKIAFGLSGRQLASIACAIGVVAVTAFVLWFLLGINFSIVEYILILEALPFVAYGFIRHKGMPFEQVVRIRWNYHNGTKRLLNKTSLDFLPSLYPLTPSHDPKFKGVSREIASLKEKRARRKQCECLAESTTRKHGSHFARKKSRKAERRKEAPERTV